MTQRTIDLCDNGRLTHVNFIWLFLRTFASDTTDVRLSFVLVIPISTHPTVAANLSV
jgi:hypothetical protein